MRNSQVSVFLDSLVHASATGDRSAALRHRAFIVSGTAAGTLAIAATVASLALGGPRPIAEVALLALLAGEMAVAAYLSRTGNIDLAQIASAFLLTALILGLAAMTGGARSPVLVRVSFVPLDASLAGSRRALVAAAAIVAAGLAGLLAVTSILGNESKTLSHELASLPTIFAILIGSALALRVGWVIAGMTRLVADRESAAPAVTDPPAAVPSPPPGRSAEVTAFVPKERPRHEPVARPAAEFDRAKELRRA
jgi:cell cycle sensor histidine kinase DivJ